MEKSMETAWVGQKVEWAGPQRIISGGQTVRTRLIESEMWSLLARSVREGLIKGIMASASTSIREKTAPSALTLKPDNSSSAYVHGTFKLLPQQWDSEWMSPSASKPV